MSRRGRGEGSIYKRPDGLWVAQVSIGWKPGGKRVRKSIYGKSRTEVRTKLLVVQRDKDAGFNIRSNDQLTLGAYLERWLEATGPSVRPRTLVMYALHVRRHIVPELGARRLVDLTADDVQIFLNRKLAMLAPKSVSHLRSTLRGALNQAVEWGYLSRNVVTKTKPPKLSPRQLRVLDQDEAKRLLLAAQGDRVEALYTVALAMGLRLGEALCLRWEDVDFGTGRLHVRHGLQRIAGELTLTDPKTALSNRSIKMPGMVARGLADHRARQHVVGIVSPYVFTTFRGTPIDPRNALREFKTLLGKAGLPQTIRFHDLRHSCASLLLAKGVNVKVIAELLGHSNATMLLSTYAHVLPQMRDSAALEMDEVLG